MNRPQAKLAADPRSSREGEEKGAPAPHVHDVVHLVDAQIAVDVLHGLTRAAHRGERLLVDVGRLDRVDLVLEHGDLVGRLLERVLVRLLALQRGFCSYPATLR